MADDTKYLLIGGAVAAYFFWPQISSALGIGATAPAAAAATPPPVNTNLCTGYGPLPAWCYPTSPLQTVPGAAQQTNSSPITSGVPGVTTSGATSNYNSGVVGSGPVTNVPVGSPLPSPGTPVSNCPAGWQLDAAGVCTQYSDQILLSEINSLPYTGSTAIPAEQINRIDPQVLAAYSSYPGITPGTVLAFMLGLGSGAEINGSILNGSDGHAYQLINGVFVRQGTSTQQTQPVITAPVGSTTPAKTAPVTAITQVVATLPAVGTSTAIVGTTAPATTTVPATTTTVAAKTQPAASCSSLPVPSGADQLFNSATWLNWVANGCTAPKLGRLGNVNAIHQLRGAIPINSTILTRAAVDPQTAALVGRDPRAMLTGRQWNYYFGQATGQLQIAQLHPEGHPNALMSAQDYQLRRAAAGLPATEQAARLGLLRNSLPGMFPLGGIGNGPDRRPYIPPANHNIYRIVGRGAVTRLGLVKNGGGDHRWARSPFPRPAEWREAE